MGKVDNNKHIVNSSDGKSGRSGLNVMLRLIGLVKPLAGYMAVWDLQDIYVLLL